MHPTWLVIQHVLREDLGAWDPLLRRRGIRIRWSRPFRGDRLPATVKGIDGLIVLGGPQSVYEQDRYPYLARELRFLEKALKRDLPILGICLGSQLLAEAGGGRVSPGHRKEIGWYPVALTPEGRRDPAFEGFPKGFQVFQWHGDTFTLPRGAKRLVSSAAYPNQAFRLGCCAYGLQFHFEMTRPLVHRWVDAGGDEITRSFGKDRPRQILRQSARRMSPLCQLSGRFLKNILDGTCCAD